MLAAVLQATATQGAEEEEPGQGEAALEAAEGEPPWERRSREQEEGAREAELGAAVATVRRVAGRVEGAGAGVELHYWVEGGAWTLLSMESRAGRGKAGAVEEAAVVPGLERQLRGYVGQRAVAVRLRLRRQGPQWELESFGAQALGVGRPLEARRLAVRRVGPRADTVAGAREVASRVVRALSVPEGGRAEAVVEVQLEDDWVVGGALQRLERQGGAATREASPQVADELVQALLPFTGGVGPRVVRLRLEGEYPQGAVEGRWQVVEAGTVRPEVAPPPEVEERYALYERVLRESREQTKQAFLQAGALSAEFLAMWVVGGLVVRGTGVLLEAAAPRLAALLARGGAEVVGWLRTFFQRLRPSQRELFSRLWLKAESRTLSVAERQELQALLTRFERMVGEKLDDTAKDQLRADARRLYYKWNSEFENMLRKMVNQKYPVHHKIPLEYAHLFPEMNINAQANLCGVGKPVHESINRLWIAFRSASAKASPADVQRAASIIDRHFKRWYDRLYNAGESSQALVQAEKAARAEIETLLRTIL